MKQLHDYQLKILKKLLLKPSCTYTVLRPEPKVENNQLTFHLNKLLEMGYIAKQEDKSYVLTTSGKEYANRMDHFTAKIEKQPKIGVLIIVIDTTQGKPRTVVETRLKHPFYGCQGFMTGKIKWGTSILETAERELKEETNLEGKAEFMGIKHWQDYDKDGNILADKCLFMCKIKNPTGTLRPECDEGQYNWVYLNEFDTFVTKPYDKDSIPNMKEFTAQALNLDSTYTFDEVRRTVDTF